MSTLKAILESHPIKNLNAVIRSVKSDIAPKLALSKDKKRHSKAKLIEHILELDKMGLLKERPAMYEKPARAKKVKAEPKAAPKAEPKAEPKPKVEDKPKKKIQFIVKNPGNPIIAPKKKTEPKEETLTATKADGSKVVIKKKDKSKKKPPTAWNKYVKKMGGVKKAAADKAGFEKFKKSL